MTTIILPDLEDSLGDEAQRRGTTTELLVLDRLRQISSLPSINKESENHGTLFDFLAGYVGTVDGPTEPLSEDCGRRFADGLAEKQLRERP